jgi:hypothetical protein
MVDFELEAITSMPARHSDFPNYRERSALQAATVRDSVTEHDMHPAGAGTIAVLMRKGWLERLEDATGAPKFKITPVGSQALAAQLPPYRR